MAVHKAHGSAKGTPVAFPGDRLDCACIISDSGASQQKPAGQKEPLAVQKRAFSSQDSVATGWISDLLTAGMSRAGDAGTGCNSAASKATDAPGHVEGRREGSPPPCRACAAAQQKEQCLEKPQQTQMFVGCKQEDGSMCIESVLGPCMRGCTPQSCQHLPGG